MAIRKRRKPTVLVPLASMGDIAFLLIIFFMLVSNFARESNIKVEPPTAGDLDQLEMGRLSVIVDEEATIYLNGTELTGVEELEALLSQELGPAEALAEAAPEARMVQFKADKTLRKGAFEPVLAAISEAGGIIEALADEDPALAPTTPRANAAARPAAAAPAPDDSPREANPREP